MRIIICGAGRVGLSIAGYLCQQKNHVTVIDNDPHLIKAIVNKHDIHGLCGHASQPDVLSRAGAYDADVIIAVTDSDEVNMVACQVAHSIFNISRKIARIRHREYRDPAWADLYSRENMPIDIIISPEEEIAETILLRMGVPGTTNDITLHDDRLNIFGLVASTENGLADQSLKNLFYNFRHFDFSISLVIHDQKAFIPKDDYIIGASDEVYFAVERYHLAQFLSELGIHVGSSGNIIIAGGGEIGRFLGERVQNDPHLKKKNLILIEADIERARFLNRTLPEALVLNGSAMEDDILTEAETNKAAIFVSVMNNNENNILSAMIAKKMGAEYALALSTNSIYNQLLPDRAVDAIINPEAITVSKILRYLRRGRILSVNTLRQGYAELIEAEVTDNCSIANIPLSEINLPKDIRIISIYNQRDRVVTFPTSDSIIKDGDIVSVLSLSKDITKVERLFSFSIDLF